MDKALRLGLMLLLASPLYGQQILAPIFQAPPSAGGGNNIANVEYVYYSTHGASGGSCTGTPAVVTLTFGTSTTSSNELIYVEAEEAAGGTLGTMSDDKSNSYTTDISKTSISAHYAIAGLFVLHPTTGTKVLTFTAAGSDVCTNMVITAAHYTNVASHDVSATFPSSGTSSSWSTGNTTTNANDLLIGLVLNITGSGPTLAAGTGWTNHTPTGSSFGGSGNGQTTAFQDQLVTATGTYNNTGTSTAGTNYAGFSSFKST